MRGGRSLLVLFVAFAGLLAYLYFVDAKKPVTEEGAEKHDKVFTVDADKIEGAEGQELPRRNCRAQEEQGRLAARGARRGEGGRVGGIGHHQQPLVRGDSERGRRGAEGPAAYGLATPRIEVAFKACRRQGLPASARGQQDADRRRPLRAARRRQEGVPRSPSYVETSFDRKPFDLRDKKILDLRSREGGSARARARRSEGGAREGGAGLEPHRASAGEGRLRRRRIDRDAAAVGPDEVAPDGTGHRPAGVRARQARCHRDGRPRQHARDARVRQGGRERRRLREGPDTLRGGHGGRGPAHRGAEETV